MTSKAFGLAQLGNAYADGALSNRNKVINGAMTIDQRNAGAAVTINTAQNIYVVDRWSGFGDASDGVFTVEQSSVSPAGFTNSLLSTVTTADASVGAGQLYLSARQKIEGFNFASLSWGTASAQAVTLSFWVRSSLTGTFGGSLTNGDQNRSYPFAYTISAANTWEYKTITIEGDTSGTWLTTNGVGADLFFSIGTGSTYSGTAGAWAGATYYSVTGATNLIGTLNATWQITGVQLEAGDTATPFEHRSYGQELALCERYFAMWRSGGGALDFISVGFGYATSATGHVIGIKTPVTLRATPTVSFTGTLTLTSGSASAGNLSSVGTIYQNGPDGFWVACTNTGSGGTNGFGSLLYCQNSTANSFSASAEL